MITANLTQGRGVCTVGQLDGGGIRISFSLSSSANKDHVANRATTQKLTKKKFKRNVSLKSRD